jgi:hypothetical protein
VTNDHIVRGALWISVPFNIGGAFLFAFPSSELGQLAGLPSSVPASYRALLAFFPLLFAGAYAWIASQRVPDRSLVALSSIGKAGVFVIILALWLADAVPGASVVAAIGDLVLAAIFVWWLSVSGWRDRRASF